MIPNRVAFELLRTSTRWVASSSSPSFSCSSFSPLSFQHGSALTMAPSSWSPSSHFLSSSASFSTCAVPHFFPSASSHSSSSSFSFSSPSSSSSSPFSSASLSLSSLSPSSSSQFLRSSVSPFFLTKVETTTTTTTTITEQQKRHVASRKGVEPKENKISWLYRIKKFFNSSLTDGQPQKRPPFRWGPDVRELSSAQWVEQGFHKFVRALMQVHGIVPDVLPKAFSPTVNLVVAFGETTWDVVSRGNFLEALALLKKPYVTIKPDGLSKTGLYTFMMMTPDEPAREHPLAEHKVLWFVHDIPGSDPTLDNGKEVIPFTHPLPLKNSGDHRYVFIFAEQHGPLDFSAPSAYPLPTPTSYLHPSSPSSPTSTSTSTSSPDSSSTKSPRFITKDFIHAHHLKVNGLCFCQSSYDPELADLYKQQGLSEPFLETEFEIKNRIRRRIRIEALTGSYKDVDPS